MRRHQKGRPQLSVTSASLPRATDETSRPSPDEMLERGVFMAPYVLAGAAVLIVVNRNGERLLEVPLAGRSDEGRTWLDLWRWLDVIDPLPKKRDEQPSSTIRPLRLVQ